MLRSHVPRFDNGSSKKTLRHIADMRIVGNLRPLLQTITSLGNLENLIPIISKEPLSFTIALNDQI